MIPPLVSFVTWNRLGLTARNLQSLLASDDEFELHIIDNNSQDDTWQYIESLRDERIKARERFDVNRGPVYASNYNLSKRKKDQFFITIDNDVNLHTVDWLSLFLKAFEEFPGLGLLGAVRPEYYEWNKQTYIKKQWNGLYYIMPVKGYVEGCCQCLRPELLNILGYWNEENCTGDMEICYRIRKYTNYDIGYFPCIKIDQRQNILCDECSAKSLCKLQSSGRACFDIYKERYRNPQFRNRYIWKYQKFISELEKGGHGPRCASIHDEESIMNCKYNRHMAEENFRYYIENSN